MNVIVRHMKKEHVMSIDKKARDKGMSRQKYLKNYLNRLVVSSMINNEDREIKSHMLETNRLLSMINKRLEELDHRAALILLALEREREGDVEEGTETRYVE